MNYVACIAEGAAETAIIDILLDHHLLIFDREEMLDEQVLRCRSASVFESRYLRKGFSDKITVYRILDSRREKFCLSKAYEHKVDVMPRVDLQKPLAKLCGCDDFNSLIVFEDKKVFVSADNIQRVRVDGTAQEFIVIGVS